MTDFFKYPSIGQYMNVVKHVRGRHDFGGLDENGKAIYCHNSPYPKIRFNGTVKIHGTNAAITKQDGTITAQSRNRTLSIQSDNNGFAAFVAGIPTDITDSFPDNSVVYGEWCGTGIQRGVAVSELPRMFVIFNVLDIESDTMLDLDSIGFQQEIMNDHHIFIITQFGQYSVEIDFEEPHLASAIMQEMTEQVETECPVGKKFGVSGVGEGIVWTSDEDLSIKFKVKGEKHSVSKVKTLAPVDAIKVANIKEFIEMTVTMTRMEQGIQYMTEMGDDIDVRNTGIFMRWMISDILKEELESLTKSELCAKDVSGAISCACKPFWFDECNKLR